MTKRTTRRTPAPTRTTQAIRDLQELIAAIDRRVPKVERSGEAAIARAATALRDEATRRIADLEREATSRSIRSTIH